MFFQEAAGDSTGTCLPSLETRPISNKLKARMHSEHEKSGPNIYRYSHPLPLARDVAIMHKDPSHRHKLLHAIKLKREWSLQQMVGAYAIPSLELAPMPFELSRSKTCLLPSITPNNQHDLRKKEVYTPLKHIFPTQRPHIKFDDDGNKKVKFTLLTKG